MDTRNVVYTYDGILFSLKRELLTTATISINLRTSY